MCQLGLEFEANSSDFEEFAPFSVITKVIEDLILVLFMKKRGIEHIKLGFVVDF